MSKGIGISIHALREEGDAGAETPPPGQSNFYPRPPRGGRPLEGIAMDAATLISIHALREEGDLPGGTSLHGGLAHFYPRPPRGGRRPQSQRQTQTVEISIHALREEGDRNAEKARRSLENFYPRPPRGGRRSLPITTALMQRHFYPRPPRGGRRRVFLRQRLHNAISIHALREEGD